MADQSAGPSSLPPASSSSSTAATQQQHSERRASPGMAQSQQPPEYGPVPPPSSVGLSSAAPASHLSNSANTSTAGGTASSPSPVSKPAVPAAGNSAASASTPTSQNRHSPAATSSGGGPIRAHQSPANSSSSRPVHSCSECRRKKLRCDRERPCHQCQKSRRTSLCSYDNISTPRAKARGPYQRSSGTNGNSSTASSSAAYAASNENSAHGEINRFRLEAPSHASDGKSHANGGNAGSNQGPDGHSSSGAHDSKPAPASLHSIDQLHPTQSSPHHSHLHPGSQHHQSQQHPAGATPQQQHQPPPNAYGPIRHSYRSSESEASYAAHDGAAAAPGPPPQSSWNAVNMPSSSMHPAQQPPHPSSATMAHRGHQDMDGGAHHLPPIRTSHDHRGSVIDNRRESVIPDLTVIEDLQRRVMKLEDALVNRNSGKPRRDSIYPSMRASSPTSHGGLTGRVLVKHNKSKFQPAHDKSAMFWHFEPAVNFLEASMRDRAFKNEMIGLHKRYSKRRPNDRQLPKVPDLPYDLAHELLLKMPSEAVCKMLVQIYLTNYETIYRVLHIPDFVNQCEKLWNDKQLPSDEFTPQFAAVLVIGCTLIQPRELTTADGHAWNPEALLALLFAWEQRLIGGDLLNFSILQTRCLLVIARHLIGQPTAEISRTTGRLVRAAMFMGLHHDPSESSHIGAFQGELRRRVWYCITEMDLQTSLCCGLPPAVHAESFNTRCPANVDDHELLQIMSTKQAFGRPLDQWTDATFATILGQSIHSRLRAASPFGSTDGLLMDFAPVHAALNELASLRSLRTRPVRGPAGDILGDMMVENHLMRSLIAGLPSVSLDPPESKVLFETVYKGAQIVLANLERFEPSIIDASVFGSGRYWNVYQAMCADQIVQSAMILTASVRPPPAQSQKPHDFLSVFAMLDAHNGQTSKSNILRAVDGVVASLTNNVEDLGRHLKSVICMALALQCARSQTDAMEQSMREAIHRVVDRCNYLTRHESQGYSSASLMTGAYGYDDDSLADLFGFDLGLDVDFGGVYDAVNGQP